MAEKEYIERKALLKDIELLADYQRGERQQGILGVCTTIRNRPAADVVEVRRGEWLFEFELDGSNFYRCSVCGRQECLLAKESIAEYFPYCHCGAKMDGKGEGE